MRSKKDIEAMIKELEKFAWDNDISKHRIDALKWVLGGSLPSEEVLEI